MDNVADGKQDIEVNGIKRHVLGYLQDFLFPPKRAMTPVKALSGENEIVYCSQNCYSNQIIY